MGTAMTVQEAFELIVQHTFIYVASGERDILLIDADEADDFDDFREPQSEWHIWLGDTHGIYTASDRLKMRFEDDNGHNPFETLTDTQWDELIEMLRTSVVDDIKIAITERYWRDEHKDYTLCGNCGEDDAEDFAKFDDFLCLGCADDIYQQGDKTNIHWAYAKGIMERPND